MEADFEVHIVGYEGTDLQAAPAPFFLNVVRGSSQGFTGIATVETSNLAEAYQAFTSACAWCEEQLKIQSQFGVHVKLEATREQTQLAYTPYRGLPLLSDRPLLIQSPIVAAWDVHLDGQFDSQLMAGLQQEGFLLLEYENRSGRLDATLTLHFLRQHPCQTMYQAVLQRLQTSGGFNGTLYWEDPLAFVVYGPTLPRPIILQ